MVGNIHNERGRSLYVRLPSHYEGALSAGKWTDAESGDHGDLLDIIAASCGHASFRETLEEARRFLSLSMEPPAARNPAPRKHPAGTPQAARRSEEHTSELQSLMRISYDVFCLKKKKTT